MKIDSQSSFLQTDHSRTFSKLYWPNVQLYSRKCWVFLADKKCLYFPDFPIEIGAFVGARLRRLPRLLPRHVPAGVAPRTRQHCATTRGRRTRRRLRRKVNKHLGTIHTYSFCFSDQGSLDKILFRRWQHRDAEGPYRVSDEAGFRRWTGGVLRRRRQSVRQGLLGDRGGGAGNYHRKRALLKYFMRLYTFYKGLEKRQDKIRRVFSGLDTWYLGYFVLSCP